MGIRDTFAFNREAYRAKLSQYTERKLRKKHHRKVVEMVVFTGSVSAGIASAPFTFGTSLVGAAYALRQMEILLSQATYIEEEYEKYNSDRLRVRKRDVALGFGLATILAGLAVFIPVGLHEPTVLAVSTPSVTVVTAAATANTTTHSNPHIISDDGRVSGHDVPGECNAPSDGWLIRAQAQAHVFARFTHISKAESVSKLANNLPDGVYRMAAAR